MKHLQNVIKGQKKAILYTHTHTQVISEKQNNESGRSMVEMLATLAVMGILGIVSVFAFRHLMNRRTANELVYSARMIYSSDILSLNQNQEWENKQSFGLSNSDLFFTRFDKAGHLYVKVNDVKEAVCKILLTMKTANKLDFYTESDELFQTCQEYNNMVLAFDGVGKPIQCVSSSDCEGEESYCNLVGKCAVCGEGETLKDDRSGCLCSEDELTCGTGSKTWCCGTNEQGKGLICGSEPNQCIDGGGVCGYNFHVGGKADDTYYTDCSYTVSDTDNVEEYYGDCNWVVQPLGTTKTWQDGTGTNKTMYDPASGTMYVTPGTDCTKANTYCALLWQDADGKWEANDPTPNFPLNGTGVIWGKCQMLSTYDKTPIATYTTGYGLVNAQQDCGPNTYCTLLWTEDEWSGDTSEHKATASATGTIYGKCQMLSTRDQTPLIHHEEGTVTEYTIIQDCPKNEWCYLNWETDQSCTAAGPSATTVHGVCTQSLSQKGSCPYGS